MKKIVKIQKKMLAMIVILALAALSSCNQYEVYEKEQYKPVFSITSHEDSYNVFNSVVHLGRETTTKYVNAYVGGTTPTTENIEIELVLDPTVMSRYKNSRLLPSHMYKIDNYNIVIPAGKREGQMKVELKPEGLSPDSTYFIPLNVYTYLGGELNSKKSYVLYRVMIKNRYATQVTPTIYAMRAQIEIIRNGNPVQANIRMNKEMKPLGKRKVRIPAGNELIKSTTEEAQLAFVQNNNIVVEVTDATTDGGKKVNITPVKHAKVEQLSGDAEFSNVFKITTDPILKKTYKTFLLHYRYQVPTIVGADYTIYPTDWVIVKEELKLEFKPEQETEEDLL